MNSNGYTITEIFSEIPVNRTCADFYMLPLTRWKCEGFDAEIPVNDSANGHMGLAEFVVGYINDAIQKQYISGETASVCWYILLLCLNHFAMKEIWKSTITNFYLKSILKGEHNCLSFLRRNSGSFSFALEVANVGTTSTYKFELTGNMDQRLFFKTRELASRTNYFFISVYKYIIEVNTPFDLAAVFKIKRSDTFNFLGNSNVSWPLSRYCEYLGSLTEKLNS